MNQGFSYMLCLSATESFSPIPENKHLTYLCSSRWTVHAYICKVSLSFSTQNKTYRVLIFHRIIQKNSFFMCLNLLVTEGDFLEIT